MKTSLKRLSILMAMSLSIITMRSQQDAMFTHYMMNTLWLNPAYAGSRDAITLTALGRKQWVGFPGAPTTGTFTGHMPIWQNKMGVGLSVLGDKIGKQNFTSVFADLAYRIQLNKRGSKLAFGLKGGVNQSVLNPLTKINDANDGTLNSGYKGKLNGNMGAGIYYSSERFYAGVSTPKLFENKLGEVNGVSLREKRHYFLILGGLIHLTDMLDLKPTSFVKMTLGAPLEADLTGMFIFDDRFNAGLGYRTGDALSILLGYNFTEQLYLGYSYDFSFTNRTGFGNRAYNTGSHEVVLRYDLLFKEAGRIKSPRYF